MISINNLTVAFGGFTLLDDISFHVSDGEHIALVGKNGAGKSTILKLIAGVERPTSGSIMKPREQTVGYLPQIMSYSKDTTVMEAAMSVFADHFTMNERLEEISRELGERTDYESAAYHRLIEELNELNDKLAMSQSESPAVLAEKTLVGLGFKKSELGRQRSTFSQGWNMRVELAKVLLTKPDVLLLDEPTNHLDIESIQWLEDYLFGYRGSVVLISHDRRFLDRVTTRTVEIVLGHIYDYKVPYSKYVELRRERMEQQRAAYENQQRMIEKTEEFIERFRYKPTKSNQVQSRIKQLDKLERIEIDVEDNSALHVKFPPAPRSGQIVFQAKALTGGYPPRDGSGSPKVVFTDIDLTVERGEKVAFVGRNGEGKSTMMKYITGELRPVAGSASLGYNVALGYYAQNQEDVLDKNDTVYDTLDKVAVGDIRTKLRDILGAFLFRGEDIDKKVAVLSGGERSRLAMAKLILHPYNLLALDEPTNHMDIRSKDVLKQALQRYDGTLVIVSHDRDFLDGLVDKVYEFRDGHVKEYLGGVRDFIEKRRIETLQDLERSESRAHKSEKSSAAGQPAVSSSVPQASSAQSAQASKPRTASSLSFQEQKEQRRKQKRIESCEKKIADLEAQMKELEKVLAAPSADTDIDKLTREYLELKRTLDRTMEEWIELSN
ncbi:MAG TPA: ABC-F family ATP-binding cassette domain-containing protein [Candidatus Coprenecus merdigallinarum]|nr:ABC-F family ATP-binding cassette domain-containing protein [Candidatus Coprenecus merdigallinarum]